MGTKKYKLKTTFDEFYVEERHNFDIITNGKYLLFKLEKMGLDTLAVLRMTAKYLKVPRKVIGYSGLKDRYSQSCQYVTIPKDSKSAPNLPKDYEYVGKNMKLSLIGELESPLKLGSHISNFFRITVRRMNSKTLEQFKTNLNLMKDDGAIPNYFDSQKFGFLRGPEGFFAGKYLKGDYEGALKLVIAHKNRKERPSSKVVHQFIKNNWYDWASCSEFLKERNFNNYFNLTTYLEKNPDDYHGAIKLFSREIIKLKVTSLQAYLWNEYLKSKIRTAFTDSELAEVKYHVGTLLFVKKLTQLNDKLKELITTDTTVGDPGNKFGTIPLPSPEIAGEVRLNYDSMMREDFDIESITEFEKFIELGYKTNAHARPMFFSPSGLKIEGEGFDPEVKKEKNKYCTLSFELPPGSYATVLIKALIFA